MILRLAAAAAATAMLVAACGDGSGPEVTARPITRGPALQLFLREAYEAGLFEQNDPIDIAVEEMLYDEARRAAQALGLGLYATAPGGPPYEDGLPGFYITARGEFLDGEGGVTRREGVAAAFVDMQGRFTYTWRFVE